MVYRKSGLVGAGHEFADKALMTSHTTARRF